MAAQPEIISLLGKKDSEALDLARSIKLHKTIDGNFHPSEKDYLLISEVLEVYELAIIDLWKFAFDGFNPDKKNEFHRLCKDCFNLLEVMEIPENSLQKIKHVLKMITYSYLGEKWENMNRFLHENNAHLSQDSDDWDMRLFETIYAAILHLTEKKNREDLAKTDEFIVRLREEQQNYEKKYLTNLPKHFQRSTAYELASLYHLAKSVEIMGEYMMRGTPNKVNVLLEMNFEKSITYCRKSGQMELELIILMLQLTFKKMAENSIWTVANRINSRVKEFTKMTVKSKKPVFELMYPQREAILEQGLLDPASRAIVVTLPTSSGKTMIAEFRILQALNQSSGSNAWIAYVVPTRALVNQITNRLRKDLGGEPLNIKVEKISGALEPDAFERSLIRSENAFDVLVVTPEKLNLLIRQNTGGLSDSLVLAVVDEAHNIGDEGRGLNLEMMLSIIKNDCENASLLLLTPFLPNSDKIAAWLDPEKPKSIKIKLDWRPNDSVVGLVYPSGGRRKVSTHFMPLMYPPTTINTHDEVTLDNDPQCEYTFSKVKDTKYILTSLVSKKMIERGNVLVLANSVTNTWNTAKVIAGLLPASANDEQISLVKKFIAAEMGEKYPLLDYLDRGVGVHNAGMPDEIKYLMEWLMEDNLLKVLVSTTTIAQGMNFPASSILLSSYSYPYKSMPVSDFWNMAGRVGRINQQTMGLIGIAVKGRETPDAIKATQFVQNKIKDVTSVLVQLFNDIQSNKAIDLKNLADDPRWSNFLQYIAHMYNQSNNLQNFISRTEITLRNTYGYNQLTSRQKSILLESVNRYGENLDENQEFAMLSDQTGFSPETVKHAAGEIESLEIKQHEWDYNKLFAGSSKTLRKLTRIMMNEIPEIKTELTDLPTSEPITNIALSGIIADWVSGKEIPEISKQYFGGTDMKSIKNCVTTIYGKISNYATWGLSSIQKMPSSGIGPELTDAERSKIYNLPAMIYYGVNSDEAILMRRNNMPRSIAAGMGAMYVRDHADSSIYDARSPEVMGWLNDLDHVKWNATVPAGKRISGADYKQIWQKISGVE